jgi:hypothetical protein
MFAIFQVNTVSSGSPGQPKDDPMTRSTTKTRLVLASLTALSLSPVLMASAASADDIDRREIRQEQRIREGLRSGEINRREYRRLEAEQANIRELERRAKADGHVSAYERAQIAQAQNAASLHIYQDSHNSDRRWWRRWY